ncbi:hypothetical protein [Pelagicoccus mobilis]|nr:hypothetical protein [Pelagicoccus mobilis]
MDTKTNRSNKSLQATAANARLFHYDPMEINHLSDLNDSLGLVT